ncbi:MAG: M14 family metallopeptidase [Pseudomonadota bacterium]
MRLASAFAALMLSTAPALAGLPFTEADYALEIPTLQSVVGHKPGEEMTTADETLKYIEALRDAAPDRMRVVPYAESWQGRQLVYAVIGSPENMAKIDEIKASLSRLSDGRSVTGAEREKMVRALPAVTWLGYAVHGNEISPTDAGLAVAYHLLAARGDADVDAILDNTIVIIDPLQNPDGRERFIHNFESARGLEIRGDNYAAERREPWPGGRLNHALFDMNRDWFSLTQPETRGRVKAITAWNPVATVDAHEMGSASTYFFAPPARPITPFIVESQREGYTIIGEANAAAFDKAGVPYFTREVFDMLYPGYGETWPALNGAIGMTYEQASPRGLAYNRADGSVLTYEESVFNHFLSTLTTAATVAKNKDKMLGEYVERRASAVKEGEASSKRYTIIDLSVRTGQAYDFAERMTAQGIPVTVLPAGAKVCSRTYDDGALIVDRAAPNGRLISTLLDTDTPIEKDYMTEQEERRARGLRHELYDVTAWSVPLMDGLSATTCARADLSDGEIFTARPTFETLAEAEFGYVLPWDDAGQARLLIAALREGLRGKTTEQAFTQDGTTYGRGSVVFSHAMNDDLQGKLAALLKEHGGEVLPMQSSWVEEGPNFGSAAFRDVTLPRVAMAWGMGTSALSAGASRYVAEQQLGLPVTPIRVMHLGFADLPAYDVLLLPETGYDFGRVLGGGAGAIQEFVRNGGVVIGLGSAVDSLAGSALGLLPAQRERRVGEEGSNGDDRATTVPGTELWSEADYQAAIASGTERPDSVPGVLVRATANEDHFLSAGYEDAITLFRGATIYSPLKVDQGTNVFRYADAEKLLASGYLWDDVRKQLARKPFVMARPMGDGMVIAFAQDPTVRAYQNGLQLLFANSLVLAPAHTD